MVIYYSVKWSNIQQFNAATIKDLKEDSTEDIVKTVYVYPEYKYIIITSLVWME